MQGMCLLLMSDPFSHKFASLGIISPAETHQLGISEQLLLPFFPVNSLRFMANNQLLTPREGKKRTNAKIK